MIDGVNSGANPQSAFFDDLSLTVAGSPTEDADFDNDGDVDGQDFLVWQRGVGAGPGAGNGDGDANGDGTVNGADLVIWRGDFGPGAAVPSVGAVPEPATAALLGMAIAGLFCVRRRVG